MVGRLTRARYTIFNIEVKHDTGARSQSDNPATTTVATLCSHSRFVSWPIHSKNPGNIYEWDTESFPQTVKHIYAPTNLINDGPSLGNKDDK